MIASPLLLHTMIASSPSPMVLLSPPKPPAFLFVSLSAAVSPRRRIPARSSPEGDGGSLLWDDYAPDLISQQKRAPVSADPIPLGIREPLYEVIEVKSDGMMSTKKISRRQLLKSSGLRPRDIRSVDPSLWLMNSMPSLLVREQAILLNLGSLRAIAMHEHVLVFDYNRKGGKAFLKSLLPRLNPKAIHGGPAMPFELEVVEAALLSRIQRLENKLMNIEPRVAALLEVLPIRLTADVLEQLRLSKQTLVELGSRAGALKQMLLDLLEDPHEIRRICVIGRNCTVRRGNNDMECALPIEKQIAEDEEEEIEMLLENYLQRCESCHGQAEKLLDSAKEMEDSIAVNLSSRRLEVSRVELLLQVGTFCVGVGALIAVDTERLQQRRGPETRRRLLSAAPGKPNRDRIIRNSKQARKICEDVREGYVISFQPDCPGQSRSPQVPEETFFTSKEEMPIAPKLAHRVGDGAGGEGSGEN